MCLWVLEFTGLTLSSFWFSYFGSHLTTWALTWCSRLGQLALPFAVCGQQSTNLCHQNPSALTPRGKLEPDFQPQGSWDEDLALA